MNEFKMSLFLAPISPVKDGGTGQIIKPATLKPYKTMTLQEVYRTITANTRLQLLTDRVRRAFDSGDLSAYRALKQELLPYVTPCGTFARRRSDSLLEASGLVVVDIDHLDSADEAARLRRQLFEDPFLRPELVFISPCGQGVKAFVPYTPRPRPAGCAPECRRKHPMGYGLRAVRVCRRQPQLRQRRGYFRQGPRAGLLSELRPRCAHRYPE